MKKSSTRRIVYIAIYVALTLVLDYVKEMLPFLNLPQGGSINIALIPVCLASFHLGVVDGLIVGFLWWAISSLLGLNPYFVNIAQYVLDYIIPSIIVGASAFLYKNKKKRGMFAGIIITNLVRSLSIILSGVYFWPGDAASGSSAALIGSLSYNVPYLLATLVVLLIVTPILESRLVKD